MICSRNLRYIADVDKARSHTDRILLCAYACNPSKGSEESVGWDTAIALARRGHRIVVLTRLSEARDSIPQIPGGLSVEFRSFDLHPVLSFIFSKAGKPGEEIAYLLWSLMARNTVRELQQEFRFDTAQHVTYARYWMPSPLASLSIPFIWGPLGGGESIPASLRSSFSDKGRRFERIRDTMRKLGEKSSLVRSCARKSSIALGNTPETAERLKMLGAQEVHIINSASLSNSEIDRLSPRNRLDNLEQDFNFDFVSIGRALEWKGFQFGIRAFAEANLKNRRYAIVSAGPFQTELKRLASSLGVSEQIDFFDFLPRDKVFEIISSARALVHPSMHESGGFVCLEAMAAGCPVICLNIGGPGLFVDEAAGYPVFVGSIEKTISRISDAMRAVVENAPEYKLKRISAPERVKRHFSIENKADQLSAMHHRLNSKTRLTPRSDRSARPLESGRAVHPEKVK